MDIRIKPGKLSGCISALPSCKEAHRKLICASISHGTVRNVPFTEDICITLDALKELGYDFDVVGNTVSVRSYVNNLHPVFNCGDCITAFVYFAFLACARCEDAVFNGSNKIPTDLIYQLLEILKYHGVSNDFDGTFPFKIWGKLGSGEYTVQSKYADEIVSGLLIALNHNNTDSLIAVEGDCPKSGIELTLDVLKEARIVTASADNVYIVRGGQDYRLIDTTIGGDIALAANFAVANFMNSNVRVVGLDAMSAQPERIIFDILRKTQVSGRKAIDLDCFEISELVPILAVYASTLEGRSCLKNIPGTLESGTVNINHVCKIINDLGGKAYAFTDKIEVEGVKFMRGGTTDCCFDDRLVYAATILSTVCVDDVIIKNAECITKPYAAFFDDFRRMGGSAIITVD